MENLDPFMDELRIMSYSSRTRACKELYKIPPRKNSIEVLWCLNDLPGLPEKWCPAEVLHVYDGGNLDVGSAQSEQPHLARGVILYLPGETWDEQVDEVVFLESHKLRCAVKRQDPAETQVDEHSTEGPNTVIRWRFPENISRSDEGDAEWMSPSTNNRAQANALRRANNDPYLRDRMDAEMKAPRDGHAFLTVELEKVKRELVSVIHQLKSVQNFTAQTQTCTSAHYVLPRLRHKLALRMQTCLKQTSAILGKRKSMELGHTSKGNIIDGMYYDALNVRVECCLQQFESVSRHIMAGCVQGITYFFPDYAYTQRPSECSTEFRIPFKTFSQICKVIGISST